MSKRNIVICTSDKNGVAISQDPITMATKTKRFKSNNDKELNDIDIVTYYLDAALKSNIPFLRFDIVVKDCIYRELVNIQDALNNYQTRPQSVVGAAIEGYPKYSDIVRITKLVSVLNRFEEETHRVNFIRMSEVQRTNAYKSPLIVTQRQVLNKAWSVLEEDMKANKERSA